MPAQDGPRAAASARDGSDSVGSDGSPAGPASWWWRPLPPVRGNPLAPAVFSGGTVGASSGAPRDPGDSPHDAGHRFRRRLVVVAVVSAVVGGALGGVIGAVSGAAAGRRAGHQAAGDAVTDPTLTLPVTEPSVARAVAAGSVAGIAAAVVPSVVTVHVRGSDESGTGAGVVISSDGYILTNNHVVTLEGKANGVLTVDLSPARTNLPARIVGRSPLDDLAVIKVKVADLRAARLGRSATLQVGDLVVAVGAPLGLSGSVTSGIVSALARNIDVPGDGGGQSATVLGNAIQTDAAINPGNSGGALVDADGAVVGINSAIASTGSSSSDEQSGSIGVGFAIPIDYARSVAQEIIRTGSVTHPFLGLVPDTVDTDSAAPGGPQSGAYVRSIQPAAPAARAGLRTGDVITALDGQPITSADDLIVATRAHRIGEAVTVTFVRGGQVRTVDVTLGTNPQG